MPAIDPSQPVTQGPSGSPAPARKPSRWNWVCHPENDRERLHDVGILADGTLHNPNGYPEDLVRRAVIAADERRHARKSKAAKQAAETRRERTARRVYAIAQRIVAGQKTGPRRDCFVCGKALGDPQSIERGIGSDCWQDVLAEIARLRGRAP